MTNTHMTPLHLRNSSLESRSFRNTLASIDENHEVSASSSNAMVAVGAPAQVQQNSLLASVNHDRTFTIFAHGTSHSRETNDTTLSAIYDQLKGEEFDDYLILDGPGCKPNLPGSYAYNDIYKVFKPDMMLKNFGGIEKFGIRIGIGASMSTARLKDAMTGEGAKHSAATAISNLLQLKDQGGIPGNINIVGYSRGAAVTTSQIVHQLKQVMNPRCHSDKVDPIKVNLFLIDPVAGLSAGKKPVNRLSPNTEIDNVHIKKLVAFYARDDEKSTYRPQYPSDFLISQDVETAYVKVPGRHTTLGLSSTSLKSPSGQRRPSNQQNIKQTHLNGPSTLLTDYALQFLKDNGGHLKEEVKVPDAQELTVRHTSLLNDKLYRALRQSKQSLLSKDYMIQKVKGGLKSFSTRRFDEHIEPVDKFARSFSNRY